MTRARIVLFFLTELLLELGLLRGKIAGDREFKLLVVVGLAHQQQPPQGKAQDEYRLEQTGHSPEFGRNNCQEYAEYNVGG
jgi:hypothetical protein